MVALRGVAARGRAVASLPSCRATVEPLVSYGKNAFPAASSCCCHPAATPLHPSADGALPAVPSAGTSSGSAPPCWLAWALMRPRLRQLQLLRTAPLRSPPLCCWRAWHLPQPPSQPPPAWARLRSRLAKLQAGGSLTAHSSTRLPVGMSAPLAVRRMTACPRLLLPLTGAWLLACPAAAPRWRRK